MSKFEINVKLCWSLISLIDYDFTDRATYVQVLTQRVKMAAQRLYNNT